MKGNIFDIQPVFGDEYIEGTGTVDGPFVGQIGKREPPGTDVLDLAKLVRFLPDGGKSAFYRFETFLFTAFCGVEIGHFEIVSLCI